MYQIQNNFVPRDLWIKFPTSEMYEEVRSLLVAQNPEWFPDEIADETKDLCAELKREGRIELDRFTAVVKIN
jgi:hypothetical protein